MESGQFKKWRYLLQILAEKNFPAVRIGIGNAMPLSRLHHSYKEAAVLYLALKLDSMA
ncbi:MAG: hypothetical protein NC416_17110 [Eubacterium sp.]|nr:hypothetical protein [Eubacterium sp.]